MLAASIGLFPLLTLALVIRSLSRPTALVPMTSRSPSLVSPFVASVPGKSRQSLFFGLCGSGFFDLRGIGRSPGYPFGMPPECVWPVQ